MSSMQNSFRHRTFIDLVSMYLACLIILLVPTVAFGGSYQPLSATVKTKDGTVYDLTYAILGGYSYVRTTYSLYHERTKNELNIMINPAGCQLVVSIPIDEINEIVFGSKYELVVTKMLDGNLIEGLVETKEKGADRLLGFIAYTEVEGYPARIGVDRGEIDRITFARDSNGAITAELRKKDGSIKNNLKNPSFRFSGGDDRSPYIYPGGWKKIIQLKVADAFIEVPTADILSIHLNDGTDIIILRNGKKLTGKASFGVYGGIIFKGMKAKFSSSSTRIREVVFK